MSIARHGSHNDHGLLSLPEEQSVVDSLLTEQHPRCEQAHCHQRVFKDERCIVHFRTHEQGPRKSQSQKDRFNSSGFSSDKDDYALGKTLGVGTSAIVYQARTVHQEDGLMDVAIKVIELENAQILLDDLAREVSIMTLLRHPALVRIHACFVAETQLYVVMPLCFPGALNTLLKNRFADGIKDERTIASILLVMAEGLSFLHANGYAHRDVKAANVLVDHRGQVFVTDFGVSTKFSALAVTPSTKRLLLRKHDTVVGTLDHMDPKIFDHQGYGIKVDVYAFGITALELTFGRSPYSRLSPNQLLEALKGPPPTPQTYGKDRQDRAESLSLDFQAMIAACLRRDEAERPSFRELLKYKFFHKAKDAEFLRTQLVEPAGKTTGA